METLVIYNHPLETLGSFKNYLKNYKEIFSDELEEAKDFESLIIMGGPMSVYEKEKYPFLKIELDMIRKAYEDNKHVLGICLGSQLIASALGGEVIQGGFGKEIGFQKVNLLDDFKDLFQSNEIIVFQMHGDTFSLPEKSKLLAYNNRYFQAFKIGKILGLQFHLEINHDLLESWIKNYGLSNDLLNEYEKYERNFIENSKRIIKYWFSLS